MSAPRLTFEDLVISPSESLKSALRRMTDNRKGILFVCDQDLRLMGVLTDGDVRRALLDDTLLVAPVSQTMNTDPIVATSNAQAAEYARRYSAVAVPVVDANGLVRELVVAEGGDYRTLSQELLPGGESSSAVANLNAVAVIPARGGSKRIPQKNLAVAGGKSLLGWAIQAAKNARHVGQVIVSTDDPAIAEAARQMGVDIPWMRPAELGQDDTPSIVVLLHALDWAMKSVQPTPAFGLLLEPTAPLRTSEHIGQALELLAGSDADSVVSVSELPHVFNPEEVLVIENGCLRPYVAGRTMQTRRLRGQQTPAYVLNGLVYGFRIGAVLQQRSLYGRKTVPLVTGWETFLDVDTAQDLQWADFVLRRVSGP